MRTRDRLLAILLCLALSVAGCGGGRAETGALLKMTFLDTGKSDCIVIDTLPCFDHNAVRFDLSGYGQIGLHCDRSRGECRGERYGGCGRCGGDLYLSG